MKIYGLMRVHHLLSFWVSPLLPHLHCNCTIFYLNKVGSKKGAIIHKAHSFTYFFSWEIIFFMAVLWLNQVLREKNQKKKSEKQGATKLLTLFSRFYFQRYFTMELSNNISLPLSRALADMMICKDVLHLIFWSSPISMQVYYNKK